MSIDDQEKPKKAHRRQAEKPWFMPNENNYDYARGRWIISPQKTTASLRRSKFRFPLWHVVALAGVTFGAFHIYSNINKIIDILPPQTSLTDHVLFLFWNSTQSFPPTGTTRVRMQYSQSLQSQLAIKAGNKDCIFELLNSNNDPVFGVYLHANETAIVKVPVGRWRARTISGENWYGDDKLFGPRTHTRNSTQTLEFSRTLAHRVELH